MNDATARQRAYDIAAAVLDPELPMVTLADLGILRAVDENAGRVVVTITPTYSGCPAMREMGQDLHHHLTEAGFDDVTVRTSLAPAWSSEWITETGRRKLHAAGIAPPNSSPRRDGPVPLTLSTSGPPVRCPRCGSRHTRRSAAFSGTACRSLYRCDGCDEPFEYVKEI